jgi:hypothetical protein
VGLWDLLSARCGVQRKLPSQTIAKRFWKGRPERVIAPSATSSDLAKQAPEYDGTREILSEAGRTIFQG